MIVVCGWAGLTLDIERNIQSSVMCKPLGSTFPIPSLWMPRVLISNWLPRFLISKRTGILSIYSTSWLYHTVGSQWGKRDSGWRSISGRQVIMQRFSYVSTTCQSWPAANNWSLEQLVAIQRLKQACVAAVLRECHCVTTALAYEMWPCYNSTQPIPP